MGHKSLWPETWESPGLSCILHIPPIISGYPSPLKYSPHPHGYCFYPSFPNIFLPWSTSLFLKLDSLISKLFFFFSICCVPGSVLGWRYRNTFDSFKKNYDLKWVGKIWAVGQIQTGAKFYKQGFNGTSHGNLLHIVYSCFWTMMALLSSCDRQYMTWKV